jgi:hypothetical protein
MVWPIIGAEAYVYGQGKSMKARRLVASQHDSWRNIPISLVDKQKGEQTAQAYDIACLQQLIAP